MSMTTNAKQMSDAEMRDLATALGWLDVELQHATQNIGTVYENECALKLEGGRELRTPAYPERCSYIRITQQGFELAYWVSDEWRDDPEIVMGAIVGAMCGGQAEHAEAARSLFSLVEKPR
jgi:hypothetical protein